MQASMEARDQVTVLEPFLREIRHQKWSEMSGELGGFLRAEHLGTNAGAAGRVGQPLLCSRVLR